MTTITGTALDVAGDPVPFCEVRIWLLASVEGPAVGFTAAGQVVQWVHVTGDDAGAWTVDLTPNASITPAGSLYLVDYIGAAGNPAPFTITVPPSGTHDVGDCLAPVPAAIPSAIAASAVSFAPTGTIAATTVQAAIAEVAAEAGGATNLVVQEGDTTVVATASTLDFGPGFDVAQSPTGEANVTLDLSEVSVPAASLTGTIDDARIPATIARDAEITAAVDAAVAALVASAPAALDTLDELAAALGDDANFATTITSALAGKADAATLAETIRDTIAAALVAGSNVTVTVNDAADTITIAASGATNLVVQDGDTTVVATASTLDFAGADFDVTETPTGEANVAASAAIARTATVDAAEARAFVWALAL